MNDLDTSPVEKPSDLEMSRALAYLEKIQVCAYTAVSKNTYIYISESNFYRRSRAFPTRNHEHSILSAITDTVC
jgi:hypothetical protein